MGMKFLKFIYMDVGCWQSQERKEPVMTFGLIEHNTIALCNYYSNGQRLCNIHSPFITSIYGGYDFNSTLTCKFLDSLLFRKYGKKVIPFLKPGSSPNAKEFHIVKLMSFERGTLLDDEQRLLIFIPDLHLHYFQLSYLDNFITWFENEWSCERRRPIGMPLQERISMEEDFSVLLEYIADFQKSPKVSTDVWILGDVTEMWETQASIDTFVLKNPKDLDKYYQSLKELSESLYKGAKGEFKRFLKDLLEEKITELPIDPVFEDQISFLKKDKNYLDKINITIKDRRDNSNDNLEIKSKFLEDEILKKYRNREGKTFGELFHNIKFKIWEYGNHDNFRSSSMQSIEPLSEFTFSDLPPSDQYFDQNYSARKTDFWIHHGHNLDPFNNDLYPGMGYLIVQNFVLFFEAKNRGDLIKKLESIIVGDTHQNFIQRIAPILDEWETRHMDKIYNNKIVVHAHTHTPYLEEIRLMKNGL